MDSFPYYGLYFPASFYWLLYIVNFMRVKCECFFNLVLKIGGRMGLFCRIQLISLILLRLAFKFFLRQDLEQPLVQG